MKNTKQEHITNRALLNNQLAMTNEREQKTCGEHQIILPFLVYSFEPKIYLQCVSKDRRYGYFILENVKRKSKKYIYRFSNFAN